MYKVYKVGLSTWNINKYPVGIFVNLHVAFYQHKIYWKLLKQWHVTSVKQILFLAERKFNVGLVEILVYFDIFFHDTPLRCPCYHFNKPYWDFLFKMSIYYIFLTINVACHSHHLKSLGRPNHGRHFDTVDQMGEEGLAL